MLSGSVVSPTSIVESPEYNEAPATPTPGAASSPTREGELTAAGGAPCTPIAGLSHSWDLEDGCREAADVHGAPGTATPPAVWSPAREAKLRAAGWASSSPIAALSPYRNGGEDEGMDAAAAFHGAPGTRGEAPLVPAPGEPAPSSAHLGQGPLVPPPGAPAPSSAHLGQGPLVPLPGAPARPWAHLGQGPLVPGQGPLVPPPGAPAGSAPDAEAPASTCAAGPEALKRPGSFLDELRSKSRRFAETPPEAVTPSDLAPVTPRPVRKRSQTRLTGFFECEGGLSPPAEDEEEEALSGRKKTGGRQHGKEDLTIWTKVECVRVHARELELCTRRTHRRNWQFWSPLLGRSLWSLSVLRWRKRMQAEKWEEMIQDDALREEFGENWFHQKKQAPHLRMSFPARVDPLARQTIR